MAISQLTEHVGISLFHDPADSPEQVAEAKRLMEKVGNDLTLQFSPEESFKSDPGAIGHLYSGWVRSDDEVDSITLDDRRSESLEVQLAAELRRIARYYLDLAERVEGDIAPEDDLILADGELSAE